MAEAAKGSLNDGLRKVLSDVAQLQLAPEGADPNVQQFLQSLQQAIVSFTQQQAQQQAQGQQQQAQQMAGMQPGQQQQGGMGQDQMAQLAAMTGGQQDQSGGQDPTSAGMQLPGGPGGPGLGGGMMGAGTPNADELRRMLAQGPQG